MRPRAEPRNVDRPEAVDLQEGKQRHVEAAALEVGELMRRLHDRLGVGRAAELEVEQRHAADGALLDNPGYAPVTAFLDQDSGNIGRNAEADVDGVSVAKLLGHAARDRLATSNFGVSNEEIGRKISPEIAGS